MSLVNSLKPDSCLSQELPEQSFTLLYFYHRISLILVPFWFSSTIAQRALNSDVALQHLLPNLISKRKSVSQVQAKPWRPIF